ncbi:hypothetical protein LTR36_003878 [Oleoguttula mirabilis]|uniref:SET domain-containing protein n=1 Tax=Oleoguttula mirabilis TaxID=1507867 RepID=A0AAV9JJ56_9PEZI|nr:hypothetical protein LTR36_003878 [Oleoguttula mirabilis]
MSAQATGAMARLDNKLNHIYFFIDRLAAASTEDAYGDHPSTVTSDKCAPPTAESASTSNQHASPTPAAAVTSNQCASPSSEVASLGSSDSEANTVTSSSSSSMSGLNPKAGTFTPTPAPTSTKPPAPQATRLYELRQTDDKGFALFAATFIPIGTRIICERPLIRLAENQVHLAWEPYCRLGKKQKAAYDKLHYFKPEHMDLERVSRSYLVGGQDNNPNADDIAELVAEQVRVMGTFAANNFATGAGLSVFETAARLNHSCVPNVHHSFNPKINQQTVYAMRDILPGEELVTTYLGGPASYFIRSQRLETLRHGYGFSCTCPACSDTTGQSDTRREVLGALAWGLQQFLDGGGQGQPYVPVTPAMALQQAESIIGLLIEEGLISVELTKAYRTASTQALSMREYYKAFEYAYDEAEVERNCLGTELEDLKKLGAASSCWIEHVREVAATHGVALGKPKKYKRVKAPKSVEQKQQAVKKKNEASKKKKAAKNEKERVEKEAARQKKEYEASFPGLKA